MENAEVIDTVFESDKSWEDAAHKGVSEMAESIRDIRSISLEGFKAFVTNGKITKFQINATVSVGEEEN